MTSVLIKAHRENHGTTEAETKDEQLQAKEHHELTAATRSWGETRKFSTLSQRVQDPADTLILDLQLLEQSQNKALLS